MPHAMILALISAAIVAGAFAQALTGAGFGVVVAPVLLAAAPSLVPTTLLCLTAVVCSCAAWRERRFVDAGFTLRCATAAAPGACAGALALAALPNKLLAMAAAVVIVAASCAGLAGVRVPPSQVATLASGFAAGALGVIAALPGPPVALVFRSPRAATTRATLSAVFAVVATVLSLVLCFTRPATLPDARTAVLLSAAAVAGLGLSSIATEKLPASWTSRAALAFSAVAGAFLLVRLW